MAELSIIIVNHNAGERLADCLASVEREAKGKDWEVLVLDNASSDGSADAAAKRSPAVNLIRNSENSGFARANNQASRISRGRFLLFLNPDTVALPGSLSRLLEEMRRDASLGAVGPALLMGENAFQVSFGGKVDFFRELARKGLLNAWRRRRLRSLKRKRRVDWVSGACLMTSREVLEKVAGFDEKFFLYFEDIDLCYRIREHGFRVVFLPEARVFHAGGASAAAAPYPSRLEYRKSQVYFYEKHNPARSQKLLKFYLRLSARMAGLFGSKREEARAFRGQLLAFLGTKGAGQQ